MKPPIHTPMKTNNITTSTPSGFIDQSPRQFRFARTGRLLLTASCISFVSFTAVPHAVAAKAAGTYEVKSARGSLKLDGDSVDIPRSLVKRIAGVVDGEITVRSDNTIKLKKNGTLRILEELEDEFNGFKIEGSVRGPSTVVLEKSDHVYFGKTDGPIVTRFEAEIFGEDFDGRLKTRVSATVRGSTLTLVVRFSGGVESEDFSGKVTIVAKR